MKPLIVETDIGRDPDDAMALMWLLGSEQWDIRCVCITPGDVDQIAMCRAIFAKCNIEIPVAIPKKNWGQRIDKLSSGGVHYRWLNHHKMSLHSKADGIAEDIINQYYTEDTTFYTIGPLTNIKEWFYSTGELFVRNPTFVQGGFCPYSRYEPKVKLDKFEGQEYVPTFNFNGDRPGAQMMARQFINAKYIGKNVCHTMEYTRDLVPRVHDGTCHADCSEHHHMGRYYFEQFSDMYFDKHDVKKFHDPTAAILMTKPELGVWIQGRPHYDKGKWTTHPRGNGNQQVLVDIDREKFWETMRNFG